MQLVNKKILVISPQFWGKMLISKHHYAVELANRGNEVYFLNPPNAALTEQFILDESETNNLFVIHHKLNFSYKLKFRFEPLFHWFMKLHINALLKNLNVEFDVIWSFDLYNLYPFKLFPQKAIKLFHPVDEPLNVIAIKTAKNAQFIFSTTNEILNKYSQYNIPKHFINHGLKEAFLNITSTSKKDNKIRVGFSGNLLRSDIDRHTFLTIVNQNTEIEFNCWGSYNIEQSNISGSTDEKTKEFIRQLKVIKNVVLHGVKTTNELAIAYQNMDAFLICYKVINDKKIGENYHKILEFLSTGKTIISHNFSSYRHKPDLIQMQSETKDNSQLPSLFKTIITNIDNHNTEELKEIRKAFAKNNLYQLQIDKIEKLLIKNNFQ